MKPDDQLKRSIRASFGLALILASLLMPWAEKGGIRSHVMQPNEFREVIYGCEAVLFFSETTIPIWSLALMVSWLVAMSWLKVCGLFEPKPILIGLMNLASVVLLAAWLIKLSNDHAGIGIGFFCGAVGWCLAVRAVPIEFEELPAPESNPLPETAKGQT